jgi:hypothetical protein
MHYVFKTEEEPLGLLEKIRGLNSNYLEEHPRPLISLNNQWGMNLEQALQAQREFVSDLHVKFDFKCNWAMLIVVITDHHW